MSTRTLIIAIIITNITTLLLTLYIQRRLDRWVSQKAMRSLYDPLGSVQNPADILQNGMQFPGNQWRQNATHQVEQQPPQVQHQHHLHTPTHPLPEKQVPVPLGAGTRYTPVRR
jgi:hypothetical protein